MPSKTAAGMIKYQNFSSKNDSSSTSSISQKEDAHSIVVILSHLYNK